MLPEGSRTFTEITTSPMMDERGGARQVVHIALNITERKRAEEDRENLISELQTALSEVKTLCGLLQICINCHKIRTEQGAWNKQETYILKHSDAEFTLPMVFPRIVLINKWESLKRKIDNGIAKYFAESGCRIITISCTPHFL